MTIMPRLSQISICHVEGMLWAVRMASAPMAFIISIWRMRAVLLMAAPNGPKS